MRWFFRLALLCAVASQSLANRPALGAIYKVALSPPAADALNLAAPSFTYPGDHASGLAPANESGTVNSTAFGDVVGGMYYDDVTNLLKFDFAYGNAFGFSDLVSDWNGGVHIHGNGGDTAHFPDPNTNAGVIYDLASLHTASGSRAGRVTGGQILSDTHETWLLQNQLYINIHSQQFGGGEIRGQLVLVVPEPGTIILSSLGVVGLIVGRRRFRKYQPARMAAISCFE